MGFAHSFPNRMVDISTYSPRETLRVSLGLGPLCTQFPSPWPTSWPMAKGLRPLVTPSLKGRLGLMAQRAMGLRPFLFYYGLLRSPQASLREGSGWLRQLTLPRPERPYGPKGHGPTALILF